MNDYIALEAIQPYMKNINCVVIVLDGGEHRQTNSGTIKTFRVADHTGSIKVSFVNPEFTENFQPGDILRIRGGHGNVYESRLQLGLNGKTSECKKTGEFCMIFKEDPNFSQKPVSQNLQDPRDREQQNRERRNYPPRQNTNPDTRHHSYRRS
ncbi:unnamed protein product [Caenorhabditis brenneri]